MRAHAPNRSKAAGRSFAIEILEILRGRYRCRNIRLLAMVARLFIAEKSPRQCDISASRPANHLIFGGPAISIR